MTNNKVLAVIPARYASTRFPGKPLVEILGKPMIQRVYEQAEKARTLDHVIVATDDQRIFDTVEQFGGEVEMTSSDLRNGTERVAAVASKFNYDIVVNVQGDEPFIDPDAIDAAVSLLIQDSSAQMGTLVKPIDTIDELVNKNLPKVILDQQQQAIYFSRSPIPFIRDVASTNEWLNHHRYYRHIGLYVYRNSFLPIYISLPETPLERAEKLEQLRAIENGYRIKVAIVEHAPEGIDTPDDLQTLIYKLKENEIGK
ncbi:3-deoxy-manno-octulosonate cytidylyltransferase [candidate division KSB1 bacterium]|nr:3-deoxy-manno-octulosonate cytidylyltransferase [candidate division KSB1 bacterium]